MATDSRHYKEEMQELLDSRLSPEARLEVEKHLESCEECRRELRSFTLDQAIFPSTVRSGSCAREAGRQYFSGFES